MAAITQDRLASELRALGLRRGDAVMMHSSLSSLGYVEGGAETVVDALQEAVGPGGTLLVPAFRDSVWGDRKHFTNSDCGQCPQRLRVKALALTLGETSAVLIAVDLVGSRAEFHEAVAEATGLDPRNVIVTASHTHSAPMLEALDKPHPFLDFVKRQMVDAALEAIRRRRPARIGYGVTHITGASFNTQVPLPDGRSEFTRDFRKGLSTGRPIDPRINIIRIDDEAGKTYAIEVGGYFQQTDGRVDEWIFGAAPPEARKGLRPFRVPRFHRTVSGWLNAAIRTGFVLERLEEPCASDETVRECPDMQDTQVMAYFLHIRCRKPA